MLFCSWFNLYILLYIRLLYSHVYLSMGCINLKYNVVIFISIFNHYVKKVEGKRRLCDLNVTSSSPALATKTYTLCAVGQ